MDNSERRDREMAYIADESVFAEMVECKKKLKVLGSLDPWEYDRIAAAAKEVIPDSGSLQIIPPFYCEYGTHITLGENFFANYGCIMIDVARITIGKNCLLPAGVTLAGLSTLEDNCILGVGVTVVPGVTVGHDAKLSAGAVVTRQVPPGERYSGNFAIEHAAYVAHIKNISGKER